MQVLETHLRASGDSLSGGRHRLRYSDRSLWLDFEISLFVYDADFTAELRSLQRKHLASSDSLDLDQLRRRPSWRHFTENTFRLLSPIL